jgi:Flp pilus assembly pilin Flp
VNTKRALRQATPACNPYLLREAFMISVRRLAKPEDGQDLLEYGLLTSLIAIFVLAAVRLLGNQISGVLWGTIANNF